MLTLVILFRSLTVPHSVKRCETVGLNFLVLPVSPDLQSRTKKMRICNPRNATGEYKSAIISPALNIRTNISIDNG